MARITIKLTKEEANFILHMIEFMVAENGPEADGHYYPGDYNNETPCLTEDQVNGLINKLQDVKY